MVKQLKVVISFVLIYCLLFGFPNSMSGIYAKAISSELGSGIVTLKVDASTWDGGYVCNLSINNKSNNNIENWKLTLDTSDFDLTNAWNTVTNISGNSIILTPEAWTQTISTNNYTTIGFQGNGSFNSNFAYELSYKVNGTWYNDDVVIIDPGTDPGTDPVPTNGFKVSGTTLYDANGKPFVMRGVNHAHTWYKDSSSTAIPAIAKTGSNTIRIVLSNGTQWTKDDLNSVKQLISLCKQNNLVAVLEVHDELGVDSISKLNDAINYWIEIKSALIGNEDTVILNIANEWYGSWSSSGWRDGYVQAIPKLRNAGIKNTIMVDGAGYGQYPQSIFDYGKEVLASDSLGNTMFSIHMYEYAGGTESQVKSNIDKALNQNLALVIGEFGHEHKGASVAYQTILDYCEEKNVGYLGWSWKGNGPGYEYLDLSGDWAGASLTSWGQKLINGRNGIKATSKICSVFN